MIRLLSETRLVYGNSLVDRVAKGARGSCKTLKSPTAGGISRRRRPRAVALFKETEETLIRPGVSDKTLSAGICGAWPRASRAGERTGTSAIVRSGAQHANGGTRTTRRDRVIEADDILVVD
ncbi:hypothetical protein MY4038_006343, partial [Beauveria bassiana]